MANAVGAGVAEAEAMTTPPALAGPIDTSTAAQGASDLATAATLAHNLRQGWLVLR